MGCDDGTVIFDSMVEIVDKVMKEFSGPAAGEESITEFVDDLIRDDVKRFAAFLHTRGWNCVDESQYYDRFAQELEDWSDEEYEEWLLEQIGEYPTLAPQYFARLKVLHNRMGKNDGDKSTTPDA